MINLLPSKERELLQLEEAKKLVIILGIVILISLISLILILFSEKIYLSDQVNSQKILLSQAKRELDQSEIQNLQEKIKLTNLTFSQLNTFYKEKFDFSKTLEKISRTLPSETYLANLSLSPAPRGEKFRAKVSLSGFTKTRETLFEFKKNLEKEKDFQEIYFPPINWVKKTDIDFNVTFQVISQ